MTKRKGFTLVELLLYIGIFAILAVIFSGILLTFTRVNVEQAARNEVALQLNFIMQSIQREISNASLVVVRSEADGIDDETDSALGVPHKYLVVKKKEEGNLANDVNSPVVIFAENGEIKLRRGRGASQSETTITTDEVAADTLTFTKFVNHPGRDVVEINLILSFNSGKEQQQVTRKLILGVGKAFAAVFDTSIVPGADNFVDVGEGTKRWRNGYFSGNLDVDGSASLNNAAIGNGTVINGLYNGTIMVDPPSISANANGTFAVASPVAIGASDRIFLTPPQNLDAGLIYVGARTIDATDQIEITLRNVTGAAVDGISRSWAYLLLQ